jgi:hypothetical protein
VILPDGAAGCTATPFQGREYKNAKGILDMGIMVLIAVIIVVAVVYVGYQQWLQHHRRLMIHRERVAAIERGVALPPLDVEIQRKSWGVQRLLLLAGLTWISIGVGLFPFLHVMAIYHQRGEFGAAQWLAVPVILIGVSHLVVYAVERSHDR